MYRVSPLTYIVSGVASTGLSGRPVQCSTSEIQVFDPLSGLSCGAYLQPYLTQAPGQLLNPAATSQCQYCPLSNADQFLAMSEISWSTRWRNFGVVWAYIIFNTIMAMILYYIYRVKKWSWANRPKPVRKVLYWLIKAGYYVRALLVGYFENSPSGKDGEQHRLL
jgi:ATP-binding cassette subfamily G (WHITE) protein 2 (PDR)